MKRLSKQATQRYIGFCKQSIVHTHWMDSTHAIFNETFTNYRGMRGKMVCCEEKNCRYFYASSIIIDAIPRTSLLIDVICWKFVNFMSVGFHLNCFNVCIFCLCKRINEEIMTPTGLIASVAFSTWKNLIHISLISINKNGLSQIVFNIGNEFLWCFKRRKVWKWNIPLKI